MNIFELKNALDKISAQAHEIFVKTGYEKLGELAYVDFDPKDPNQAFLYQCHFVYAKFVKLRGISSGLPLENIFGEQIFR